LSRKIHLHILIRFNLSCYIQRAQFKLAGVIADSCIDKPDILQTFDKKSLEKCRELAPFIKRNDLVSEKKDKDAKWDERGWPGLLDDALAMEAEIGPSGYLGYPWNIGSAHRKGLLVIMYTIDQDMQFKVLAHFGVDWIITNKCDKALEFLWKKSSVQSGRYYEEI